MFFASIQLDNRQREGARRYDMARNCKCKSPYNNLNFSVPNKIPESYFDEELEDDKVFLDVASTALNNKKLDHITFAQVHSHIFKDTCIITAVLFADNFMGLSDAREGFDRRDATDLERC
jgi:hypothetical protein